MRMLYSAVLVLAASLALSCDAPATDSLAPGIYIDTIGDTVSVFTVGPGRWSGPATLRPVQSIGELEGEPAYLFQMVTSLALDSEGSIYVLDRIAREVRVFNREGVHLRTLGRGGKGPGELQSPEALAVLDDGRVLVRDHMNRRLQVYGPDGTPEAEWPILNSPYSTNAALSVDGSGRILVVTRELRDDYTWSDEILIRVSTDGSVLDTIPIPTTGYDTPRLEARYQSNGGSGAATSAIPFYPEPAWGVHSSGRIFLTLSDRYALDLISEGGSVFRIGREYEPVPVTPEERRWVEDRTIAGMRNVDPNWRWDGPSIPSVKPPFNAVYLGRQGRIWTRLSTPTREEPNSDYDPSNPLSTPTVRIASKLFDVFEGDGTYLGRVEPPDDFLEHVTVFDGDDIWAMISDDLGVQRVVRYELIPPSAS